jgi:hypothetical protein
MANYSDVITAHGKIGPASAGDGVYNALRQGKQGELITSQAHGKYHEAASRGKLFSASIGVAGVAPGTALSTTPAFTLYNPTNSGVILSLKKILVGYVSGTLGAGSLVHAQNASQVAAPTGGTELTPVCALLNGSRGTGKAFTGSTISAASTLIRPSINLGAFLASEASVPGVLQDDLDGSIIVPAGVAYCYQGIAAAGTTPLLIIAAIWEEITLPS